MVHFSIRYLGIKTQLLEEIKRAVESVCRPGSVVLDMFGGSNVVGQALKDKYIVYSNDLQAFSYTTAKVLVESVDPVILEAVSGKTILSSDYYKDNRDALITIFAEPLDYERSLLDALHNENCTSVAYDRFIDLYANSPYYGHFKSTHASYRSCEHVFTSEFISKYKDDNRLFPYILFSTYYANPYFSLEQCIEIDSMRYAIDALYDNGLIGEKEKDIYLSCLIYVLHRIVCSVGDHFAQPQAIKEVMNDPNNSRDKINLRERRKILNKKKLDVRLLFEQKCVEVATKLRIGDVRNRAFNMDYKDLFVRHKHELEGVDTVYIDPPYTNAHYSRFYHIPETLVLYDYPDIEFKGRYRTDRFQSNFCIKSQAFGEFEHMISMLHAFGHKLVISYSSTSQCILTIDEIQTICGRFYNNLRLEDIDHMYRNFGQKPNRVTGQEYLLTCLE